MDERLLGDPTQRPRSPPQATASQSGSGFSLISDYRLVVRTVIRACTSPQQPIPILMTDFANSVPAQRSPAVAAPLSDRTWLGIDPLATRHGWASVSQKAVNAQTQRTLVSGTQSI